MMYFHRGIPSEESLTYQNSLANVKMHFIKLTLVMTLIPKLLKKHTVAYRHFYPYVSHDFAIPDLVRKFNKKMGHTRFPFA